MQTIYSLRQSVAFDGHGVTECNRRVEVGTCSPNLPVGHQTTEYLSPTHERSMIIDCYVGDSDCLSQTGLLASKRQIQQCRLSRHPGSSAGKFNGNQYFNRDSHELKVDLLVFVLFSVY